jgi:hypothetical protein
LHKVLAAFQFFSLRAREVETQVAERGRKGAAILG